MPELHIDEVSEAINGDILNRDKVKRDHTLFHYHFDTRAITESNTLFFALKSEAVDGHRFLPQLEKWQGSAAVVSRDFDGTGLSIPLIRVEDPMKAAQQLAAYVRKKYRHIKYVGVTGSAGKTTTKEFVYHLLSHKFKAYRSFKNWNNWIGMPFSILNMKGDEEAAVFELAMSYPGIGEIHLLAEILRPDVAVVINAFPVHLEFLKTLENVASAKSEILDFLAADDIAIINGDQEHLVAKTQTKKGRKLYYGKEKNRSNNIRLKEIKREGEKSIIIAKFWGIETRMETYFINPVHVENLFTAILVARHLGMKHVEIQEAVKNIKPLADRGEIRTLDNFTIIDETYNSNPEALKKTLDWVDKEYDGPKVAVLGDMLELGENEDQFHKEVGQFLAGLHFQRLVTVGKRARKIAEGAQASGFPAGKIDNFDDSAAAGVFLKKVTAPGSTLVFKASRGIRLEKAVEGFCADAE